MENGNLLVAKKMDHWRSRLIDLSLRNRLLNFKLTKSSTVQFIEPAMDTLFDFLAKKNKPMAVICPEIRDEMDAPEEGARECLLKDRLHILPGQVLPSTLNPNTEKVLYQTRLKARTFMLEQGVNVLYATFGILRWTEKEGDEKLISSPIVLLPVQLGKKPFNPYTLARFGDEAVLNPSLVLKMRTDQGIDIPAMPEDVEDFDLEAYLKQVELAIGKKTGWSVLRESYMGIFSFTKLAMYEDLKTNEDVASAHPIVRALAGDPGLLPPTPRDLPAADRLDEVVKPIDSHQVLDADSSQAEAIEAVRRGANLVLQGPPGTGKSQTIANMISECLWSGKTVLFVSEKMAALEVVKKRLDICRLGDYCLDLHSNTPNKSDVIISLGRPLDGNDRSKDVDLADLDRVASARDRLNAYVHFLHMKMGAIGLSPFDAYGRLAELYDVPDMPFKMTDPFDLDRKSIDAMESSLERLVGRKDVLAVRASHPWHDVEPVAMDMGKQQEFLHSLESLLGAIDEALPKFTSLAGNAHIRVPRSLADCRHTIDLAKTIVATPFPLKNWLEPRLIDGLIERVENGKASFGSMDSSRKSILAKYNAKVLELDGEHLSHRFEVEYSGTLRSMNSDYRTDIKVLSMNLLNQHRLEYEEALNDVRALKTFQDARGSLNSKVPGDYKTFGKYFDGPGTNWDALLSSLRWAKALMEKAGAELNGDLIKLVCDDPEGIAKVRKDLDLVRPSFEALTAASLVPGQYLRGGEFAIGDAPFELVPLTVARDFVAAHLTARDRLREWVELRDAEEQVKASGLDSLLVLVIKEPTDVARLVPMFRKRFFTLWIDSFRRHVPLLAGFNSAEHNALIEEFRKLDQTQLLLARKRMAYELRQRVDRMKAADPASPLRMQETMLRKEMAKKSKQMAIRKLLSDMPDLLPLLKPCVMMSPLSACQFIDPRKIRFDVVIFDEASQICPEDAIGSIMRGKQLVVVGDSKQLPPTRFFEKIEGDDEAEVQDLESILDECATIGLPQKMLLWHYRSRNESLIAFSNAYYYDNRLYTFPSADLPGPTSGIEFVYVPEGVYDRGGKRENKLEAKKVADLVFEQFKAHPEMSLGVVAFSEEQQLAILEVIEYMKKLRPEFQQYFDEGQEESFFVKNLENVQGDERDVMFFSVGYGKDQEGKLVMNFGPLNMEGGHRRLNVAITRARRHVKLITSMQPEEIDPNSASKGVLLLRRYMEFARGRGDRASLGCDIRHEDEGDRPLEDSIFNALTQMGLTLHRSVGCSGYRLDMAVMDPEKNQKHILGIECDGLGYASGRTARDRERLREEVLQGLGWNMHRIWSKDWVEDRNRELRKIEALVERYRSR
jgi:very-short-patch-repair endonuclease